MGTTAYSKSEFSFRGKGTKEEPYLIQNVDDFRNFRDYVNNGEEFRECFFYQTENFDLKGESWVPIGIYGSGHYFYGVYNGGGHYLKNLIIKKGRDDSANNQGLFGQLAGKVLNLGIESGRIYGNCVGSIASHSVTEAVPYIINCYSRAVLSGRRAGGIIDNFEGGVVINSWFDDKAGGLNGEVTGMITSYAGTLIDCFGLDDDFIRNYKKGLISCRQMGIESQITRESQKRDKGILYLPFDISLDMLIPWEWNGTSLCFSKQPLEQFEIKFEGSGTKEFPYLIQNYNDLFDFRALVNTGNNFKNKWFKQTKDIVIAESDWVPIGICNSGNYFFGVYDGSGNVIQGLTTKYHYASDLDNVGLFGRLGGVIVNLGIERANIEGKFSGVFASEAVGDNRSANIVNCYSNATVIGEKAGGIVSDFHGGTVANCISKVKVLLWGEESREEQERIQYRQQNLGGITAVSADTKVYSCYTTAEQVMPEAYRSKTSKSIFVEDLKEDVFLQKVNIHTALTQELYGNQLGISLLQWASSTDRIIQYSENSQYIVFFKLINEYFLTILLFIIILLFIVHIKRVGMQNFSKSSAKLMNATAIISTVIAFFVNCAAIGIARPTLSIGSILFMILINMLSVASMLMVLKNIRFQLASLKKHIVLLGFMALIFFLEIMQFRIIPRYDASLYYGSLVRGVQLFRMDLFTYIGAFVCWKWMHGSALLIAPLEYIFTGEIFGVYISNILITEITIVVLYQLFRMIFKKISPFISALSSAILILCPYQLGMFTYLSYDVYLSYFAIWLIYCYLKKNNLMIAFCGYLLFFSKITGGVFYVVFLISVTLFEIKHEYVGSFFKRIQHWWQWSKCTLWMLPGVMYVLAMLFGDFFTIQHFSGSYIADKVSSKSILSLGNTLIQSFGFGFRWIFVLLITYAFVAHVFYPERIRKILNSSGLGVMVATIISGFSIVLMLLLYKSDAECPRYTAILNSVYVILVPISVFVLCKTQKVRYIILSSIMIVLLVQTYWTIDPAILMHKSSIDTGEKKLYRLALDGDSRPGMNLGIMNNTGYTAIGDIYAYNFEYNFYNGLIQDMLEQICPTAEDMFYVLDVIEYELHLNGSQYQTYWNNKTKKIVYKKQNVESVYLQVENIATNQICAISRGNLKMQKDFYLIVPERVNKEAAIERLFDEGYCVIGEYHPQNIYGTMGVYHFSLE
jgi:hypothetical protein